MVNNCFYHMSYCNTGSHGPFRRMYVFADGTDAPVTHSQAGTLIFK